MKRIAACLLCVLVLFTTAVFAMQSAPPQAPPSQAQEEKAFQGALVKIDTDAKMLTAKGTDNKEWQFAYTDRTQIMGPEKSIQGLATKAGAKLKITYRVEQGINHATRIEVSEK
jgi:hypothetical protein